MYAGFPIELVTFLRCPNDAGPLEVVSPAPTRHLANATLRCRSCTRQFPIEAGIVRLLDPSSLDRESGRERALRDEQADRFDPATEQTDWQQMEIEPTVEAVRVTAGTTLLEIGCGNGRYTVRLAPTARVMIAVDFSFSSLQTLAERIESGWNIGLVHADAAQAGFAAGHFDRALSTLVSNLPTAEHRKRMMRNTAAALRPHGRFVFSTHYYGLRSRLGRVARSGYYRERGIYRYLFSGREILRETQPHFRKVSYRPIQISLPFAGRLHLPTRTLSRATERIPFLNTFGELLLIEADGPLPYRL